MLPNRPGLLNIPRGNGGNPHRIRPISHVPVPVDDDVPGNGPIDEDALSTSGPIALPPISPDSLSIPPTPINAEKERKVHKLVVSHPRSPFPPAGRHPEAQTGRGQSHTASLQANWTKKMADDLIAKRRAKQIAIREARRKERLRRKEAKRCALVVVVMCVIPQINLFLTARPLPARAGPAAKPGMISEGGGATPMTPLTVPAPTRSVPTAPGATWTARRTTSTKTRAGMRCDPGASPWSYIRLVTPTDYS